MNLIKRSLGDNYSLAKFIQAKIKLGENLDSFYFWSLYFNPFAIGKIDAEFFKNYLPEYTQDQIDYYAKTKFVDRSWIADIYRKIIYDKSFNPTDNIYRDLLINNISTSRVLLGIKDHLTPFQFDPWVEEHPWLINPLLEVFRYHKDKQFILLTSMENLDSYIKEPNVSIVPWGGDVSNHIDQYKKIEPILDKNFKSDHCFLSLNRHNRSHRIHLVSLFLSLGIENYGLISCMFKNETDNTLDKWKWQYSNESIKDTFSKGYALIKSTNFTINDGYEIYGNQKNDNVGNFKNTLSNYYKQTFVELVAETSYTEQCFLITEKTANSILGCCFPIWISSKGTVEFLRSSGMDVFDDIVDHSYDLIDDPAERMHRAITDNIDLLTNVEKTKKLWLENQQRFLQNVEYFRKDLWQFYNTRFDALLDKLETNLRD